MKKNNTFTAKICFFKVPLLPGGPTYGLVFTAITGEAHGIYEIWYGSFCFRWLSSTRFYRYQPLLFSISFLVSLHSSLSLICCLSFPFPFFSKEKYLRSKIFFFFLSFIISYCFSQKYFFSIISPLFYFLLFTLSS